MTTALIDGDTVLYAAASSTEQAIEWEEWLWTLHGDFDEARHAVDHLTDRIVREVAADEVVFVLSCPPPRWRKGYWPQYKANRAGTRKPITYKALREYAHETFNTYEKPGLEGDDVLGILATHPKLIPGDKVVCAIDKDLKTIPGRLYNYDRRTMTEISEPEADLFWMKQALMGDSTDGIPGCRGIGPKTADKILTAAREAMEEEHGAELVAYFAEDYWPYVIEAYESKGFTAEDALINARLTRILRWKDWDYEKEEVKLWTP